MTASQFQTVYLVLCYKKTIFSGSHESPIKQTVLRIIPIGIGPPKRGFTVGETLGSTQYSVGKWECTKEQGGVGEWKITKRKHPGSGVFWLNRPNRIHGDRPGWSDVASGMWKRRNLIKYWECSDGEDEGFLLNCLSGLLTKLDLTRKYIKDPRSGFWESH